MRRRGMILGTVIAVACIVAITAVAFIFRPDTAIPGDISRQVDFALYVPDEDRITVDKKSIKYDTGLGLLSFTGSVDDAKYVMAEQATPIQFTEIPQYYDKLRDSMHQYASFESINGIVYLTRPAELQGKSAAVLNAKGTLVSVRPEVDLSESQWRVFFNSLVVIR